MARSGLASKLHAAGASLLSLASKQAQQQKMLHLPFADSATNSPTAWSSLSHQVRQLMTGPVPSSLAARAQGQTSHFSRTLQLPSPKTGVAGLLLPTASSAAAVAAGSRRCMGTAGPIDDALRHKARKMALWVGAMAGTFGSFVGVGGGVLISPIIANACKSLPQRIISGTSLAAVIVTGMSSGFVYWTSGAADLTSAALVAVSAVGMAPLGARATHMFNCTTLKRFLGYWLYFVAPLVPLKAYLFRGAAAEDATAAPSPALDSATATTSSSSSSTGSTTGSSSTGSSSSVPLNPGAGQAMQGLSSRGFRPLQLGDIPLALTGVLAGFASGLLGIGGGTIVTPALAVFTGMPQTQVLGTSLMSMVLPSLVGLAQHARLGNVDWLMAAGLGTGTLVGSLLGSNVALQAPPYVLEMAFGVGMAFLGHKTLAGLPKVPAQAVVKAVAGKS